MRYEIFVTVWDEPFIRKFADYSLKSLLLPGNLPALAKDHDLAYCVYTARRDGELLAEALEPAAAFADIELRYFEDFGSPPESLAEVMARSDPAIVKHNVQRITSKDFLERAAGRKAEAVILTDSDFILSDGSLSHMAARCRDGMQAICAMFLRLEEETARPLLDTAFAAGTAALSGRALVRTGLRALHPIARRMFVDAEDFTPYPSQLNWRVGEAGYLSHCFFPHPLMIEAGAVRHYASTMDYELALRATNDSGRIELIGSSDDLLICKMTPRSYLAELAAGEAPGLRTMANFALNHTNARHETFFRRPVRYIAGDGGDGGDGDDWDAVGAEAAKFVDGVYKLVELMAAGAGRSDAANLVKLKSFLGPIEEFMSPQLFSRMQAMLPRRR